MKKTMILIAAFTLLLTSLSATGDRRRVAAYGEEAPAVVVQRHGGADALEALKGRWVVLAFWSSTDPGSRMAQTRIAAMARNNGRADAPGSNDAEIEFKTPAGVYSLGKQTEVEVMSVNFDSNESMMKEIIRLDNLPEGTQCRVASADEANRLRNAFAMESGLRTFLIDPDGNVAMADPDEATLSLLLARAHAS